MKAITGKTKYTIKNNVYITTNHNKWMEYINISDIDLSPNMQTIQK